LFHGYSSLVIKRLEYLYLVLASLAESVKDLHVLASHIKY
jgi:hypothetical protein